jgi:hypothetical protein
VRGGRYTQGGKAQLDVLGFDACLMGAAEVVSALGKYAHVFVGSQELVPGHGWDYNALAVLVDQPSATPVQLAYALADAFLVQVAQPSWNLMQRPHGSFERVCETASAHWNPSAFEHASPLSRRALAQRAQRVPSFGHRCM